MNLPHDYLNIDNYSTNLYREEVTETLINLKKRIKKPPSYCANIIKYKKRNNIPPYILSGDLMFSALIDWYYILKTEDKDIIHEIILDGTHNEEEKVIIRQFFILSLRTLKTMRNNYAHNNNDEADFDINDYQNITYETLSLLFNGKIFQRSISKNKYNKFIKKSPYSVGNICILLLLDADSRTKFMEELSTLFEKDSIESYGIDGDLVIKELKLIEFFTLVDQLHYSAIEKEERIIQEIF